MKQETYSEIMEAVEAAQKTAGEARQYHLHAVLTDLELQFKPETLVISLLTEQFGRIIFTYTQRLRRELGRAVQTDPELNKHLESVRDDLERVVDLVAHKIIKRHFNEMCDRMDESLKTLKVFAECRLSGEVEGK